ncbi:mitotic checkpoint protein-domain-containing protein [Crepidotus variabilis]|uniref:Spindle assembly checkpoint component MAD1 n=1 Tax=Crepidotus variabilis TaxID=179855 RepID=A0A9P6E8P1_9AGAR|nr:mitotic checkpoint protein-domain-containing protein [Crepidotus variabilis]
MDTGIDMDTTTVVSSFSHSSSSSFTSASTSTVAPPAPPPTTTAALQELLTLRSAHASLLDKHGQTNALLSTRSSQLTTLQSQFSAVQNALVENEELRRVLGVEREGRRREEERRGLVEREVGFLSELVGSYEREREVDDDMVVDSGDAGAGVGVGAGGRDDTRRLRERLGELERLLVDYKEANKRLGDEVGRLGVGVVGGGVDLEVGDEKRTEMKWKSVEELVKDVESVREENEKLKADLTQSTKSLDAHLSTIDTLEQTLFELRGEIAGGRHVPPNTRILEMADNPERRWFDGRKEVVDGLRRENGALMRRLEELGRRVAEWEGEGEGVVAEGEGEGVSERMKKEDDASKSGKMEDVVPRESWELVSREKEELEEMVRQKEKRLLRLQQVFTQKSSEFRDAIASILGVKLAFYPNGSVRVTSVFDLNASFVFSPSKLDGTTQMQLIAQSEQGGPQDLPSMMNYWIETQQCIPGFLASVTLECWEGSKRDM